MVDRSKFSPKGFYTAMAENKSLLIRKEELAWSERWTQPDREYDALLAFGCAVQHTPHLMKEATNVFDLFGIDYAAVTGRQFCCGRPVQRLGEDAGAAEMISSTTYDRFVSYQPKVTVQWCGACMLQYLDVISSQGDPPFQVVHVTKYLRDLLKEMGDDVPWVKSMDSTVVLHVEDSHHQKQKDIAAIIEILEMIPGVTYAGPIDPPSAGVPCQLEGPTQVGILNKLTTEEYQDALRELEDQAAAVGADTLVTPYHKCQMEWCKFSSKNLAVREWMSILAEALGVGVEDRFTTYWHLSDPEKIVELSRAEWESWGMSEDEALAAAARYFQANYAIETHQCDCGGKGCGIGERELIWPVPASGADA